jgi:hypothetical protein
LIVVGISARSRRGVTTLERSENIEVDFKTVIPELDFKVNINMGVVCFFGFIGMWRLGWS